MLKKMLFATLALLIGGCCKKPEPELTRRYLERTAEGASCSEAGVSGSVFVLEQPESAKTLLDLTEGAQTALVEGLVAAHKDEPEVLWAKLLTPLEDEQRLSTVADLTKFQRTVVISLANQPESPADRISQAEVRLSINEAGKFVSWDRIKTDFGEVDLGKVTGTDKRTLSLAGSIGGTTATGVELSLAPTITREQGLTEEVELRQRYVALTGTLTPKAAALLQQSTAGIDLTGNSTLVVQLETATRKRRMLMDFSNLFDGQKRAKRGDQVGLSFATALYAEETKPIEASAALTFVVRRVLKGEKTFIEGDDKVAALRGGCPLSPSPEKVRLVDPEDMHFSTWQLWAGDAALSIDRLRGDRDKSEDPMQIDFRSSSAAHEFLSWLTKVSGKGTRGVDDRTLYLCEWNPATRDFRGECPKLQATDTGNLAIRPIGWNWERPGDPRKRARD